MQNNDDILSFFKDTFGITDIDEPVHQYNPPQPIKHMEAEVETCDKIIDCIYTWENTGNKNELLKARFYINRLMGEQDG